MIDDADISLISADVVAMKPRQSASNRLTTTNAFYHFHSPRPRILSSMLIDKNTVQSKSCM